MSSKGNHFIILTNPRNGSSWMVSMLRSHGDLFVRGEAFNQSFMQPSKVMDNLPTLPHWFIYKKDFRFAAFRPSILFKYLNDIFAEGQNSGFKLMFKQMLKRPFIIAYIVINRPKIIRLKRQNLLDIVISQETLRQRQIAHSDEKVEQIKITLDPKKTVRELRKLIWWDRLTDWFCKIMPCKVFWIEYERLAENPALWSDVLGFILADDAGDELQSSAQKLNRLSQSEMIINYEELASYLEGKEFARFLR